MPLPPWVSQARAHDHEKPDRAWVYEITCRSAKAVHVGEAGPGQLFARIKSRWRATCRSRWGRDCIPWLHDLLVERGSGEVELVVRDFATEREAKAEEKVAWERYPKGWEVTGGYM
jgi:hypothetical protein